MWLWLGLCLNDGPDPAIAAIVTLPLGVGRLAIGANGSTLCAFLSWTFGGTCHKFAGAYHCYLMCLIGCGNLFLGNIFNFLVVMICL